MSADEQRGQLLNFAMDGERVRRAAAVMEREAMGLVMALRRALPFLGRRGVPITLGYARAMPIADVLRDLKRPLHASAFVATPSGSRGALIIDAPAVALLLDGVLGGSGTGLPVLDPGGLSSPQTALVARTAGGIIRAFSDSLSARAGLRLEPCAVTTDDAASESAPIACELELGHGAEAGRIVLVIAKEALLGGVEKPVRLATDAPDPRIVASVQQIELELVAELGRIRMTLEAVAALRVGDTLRLNLPVSGLATVRADAEVVFRGRPTTSGGQIAVRVERHGT